MRGDCPSVRRTFISDFSCCLWMTVNKMRMIEVSWGFSYQTRTKKFIHVQSPITEPVGSSIGASQPGSGLPSGKNMFNCLEWTSSYFLCGATGIAKIGWRKQKSWPAGNLGRAKVLRVGFAGLGFGVFLAIHKLFEWTFSHISWDMWNISLLRYVRIQTLICILPARYYKWYLKNYSVYLLNKYHLILGQITILLEIAMQFILRFCSLRFSAWCVSGSYRQTNNEDGAQQEREGCRSGVCGLLIARSHSEKVALGGFSSLKTTIQCWSNTWRLGSLICQVEFIIGHYWEMQSICKEW